MGKNPRLIKITKARISKRKSPKSKRPFKLILHGNHTWHSLSLSQSPSHSPKGKAELGEPLSPANSSGMSETVGLAVNFMGEGVG